MVDDTSVPFVALALSSLLLVSGCIGDAQDPLGAFSDGDDTVQVTLSATNATSEIAHIGLAFDGVFAHDAETPAPDGFHELTLANERADVLTGTQTKRVDVAAGAPPAGDYDQILFRLSDVQIHGKAAMSGGGNHEHGDDVDENHTHDDGADASADGLASLSNDTGQLDLPVNVSFQVLDGQTSAIDLVLDVNASASEEGFSPVFETITVERAGNTLTTHEDVAIETDLSEGTATGEPAPAARAAVFAPNGDQIYAPSFDVEQGVFVNSLSDAFLTGETIRFSGTESEAVAQGATIDSYEWSFGDGETATGPTAQHAYTDAGVYPVELTVTDDVGTSGTHTLHVVVIGWASTVVDTSFEDGPGDWASSGGTVDPAGATPTLMAWELDGPGANSSTAWHAGHPLDEEAPGPDYLPSDVTGSVTLTSANYTIPEDWVMAGFSVAVNGNTTGELSELAGSINLEISYTSDGESTTVTTVSTTEGWRVIEDDQALSELAGQSVQFTFTFTAPADGLPQGAGFLVDDFTLGGLAKADMANSDLLDKAGGDGHAGHDHSH